VRTLLIQLESLVDSIEDISPASRKAFLSDLRLAMVRMDSVEHSLEAADQAREKYLAGGDREAYIAMIAHLHGVCRGAFGSRS
jgi:hypothetical protein